MSASRSVLLVGGSEAGKSNYIFRLWIALRDRTPRAIMLDGQPDDVEYLAAGADAQLGGAFAGHTPKGTSAVCEIPVIAAGSPASLIIPDRPGEDWTRIYKDRRWPEEWDHLVDEGTSCLVFLRANGDHVSPMDWIGLQRVYGSNAVNFEAGRTTAASEAPTQIVMIEWFQMLEAVMRKRSGRGARPRMGIIVSAWDSLSCDDRASGPAAFLRRDFRMLSDFLGSSVERLDLRAFGVSLYGGDFDHEETFKRSFHQEGRPQDRGYVVCDDLRGTVETVKDLVAPIAWALGT